MQPLSPNLARTGSSSSPFNHTLDLTISSQRLVQQDKHTRSQSATPAYRPPVGSPGGLLSPDSAYFEAFTPTPRSTASERTAELRSRIEQATHMAERTAHAQQSAESKSSEENTKISEQLAAMLAHLKEYGGDQKKTVITLTKENEDLKRFIVASHKESKEQIATLIKENKEQKKLYEAKLLLAAEKIDALEKKIVCLDPKRSRQEETAYKPFVDPKQNSAPERGPEIPPEEDCGEENYTFSTRGFDLPVDYSSIKDHRPDAPGSLIPTFISSIFSKG